jgi:hypothetical protein
MNAAVALAPTRAHQHPPRSARAQSWSVDDDQKLTALASVSRAVDWKAVAGQFPDKTQQQVVERWTKVLDPRLVKGSWTGEEDQAIIRFVGQHGTKNWTKLAALLPGRIGKQCRERWVNHLDPAISHAAFTLEDDRQIIELHRVYGNKWAKIAALMRTRSCNAIKNRWNSTLSRIGLPQPDVPQAEPGHPKEQ